MCRDQDHGRAPRRNRRILSWPARKNRSDNPFQALLSDALEAQGWVVEEFTIRRALSTPRAIWHWHWVDSQLAGQPGATAYIRYVALRGLLVWARLVRAHIVVTAHNVNPHDAVHSRLMASWLRALDRHTAGVHYLSAASRALVSEARPLLAGKPHAVTRHGDYRPTLQEVVDKSAARGAIGVPVDARVMIHFGKLKRYKGVVPLLESFARIATDRDHLIVAGQPEDGEIKAIVERWADHPHVTVLARHLSQRDLVDAVSAADVVVLPYRNILNSGSALFALSVNRPVVVPAIGSLIELAEDVGSDWVRTYDGDLTDEVLARAISVDVPVGVVDLSAYGWTQVAVGVAELYRSL